MDGNTKVFPREKYPIYLRSRSSEEYIDLIDVCSTFYSLFITMFNTLIPSCYSLICDACYVVLFSKTCVLERGFKGRDSHNKCSDFHPNV